MLVLDIPTVVLVFRNSSHLLYCSEALEKEHRGNREEASEQDHEAKVYYKHAVNLFIIFKMAVDEYRVGCEKAVYKPGHDAYSHNRNVNDLVSALRDFRGELSFDCKLC